MKLLINSTSTCVLNFRVLTFITKLLMLIMSMMSSYNYILVNMTVFI